jgi:hypothetical protein
MIDLNQKYASVLFSRGLEINEPIKKVFAEYTKYNTFDYVVPSSSELGEAGFTLKHSLVYEFNKVVDFGEGYDDFVIDSASFPIVHSYPLLDVLKDSAHPIRQHFNIDEDAEEAIRKAMDRIIRNMARLEQCTVVGMASPDGSNNSIIQANERKARSGMKKGINVLDLHFKATPKKDDFVSCFLHYEDKEMLSFLSAFMENTYS